MIELTEFGDLQIREEDLADIPPVDLDGEPTSDDLPERFLSLLHDNPRIQRVWQSTSYRSPSEQINAAMYLCGQCGLTKGEAASVNNYFYAQKGRKADGERKLRYNLRVWEKGRREAEALQRDLRQLQ